MAYMAAADAPAKYLAVNAGTLIVGLIALAVGKRWGRPVLPVAGIFALVIALALLATALFGHSLDGTTRWVRIGPLTVQPGLILMPLLAVLFSRERSLLTTTGVVIAAAALALQPDRATAGALTLAMAALALTKQDRRVLTALFATGAAFAVALLRPDTLPAQPFVERVLFTAFETHLAAGIAVWIGVKWLLIPAIAGRVLDRENTPTYAVFGAVWLGIIAASALGNYPTPLVGYGASSILGYVLSLSALPGRSRNA